MGRAIAHDAVLRNLLKKALQKYLDRSDITEVAVNSPGIVWVEESGGWAKIEDPAVTYDYLLSLGNAAAVFGGENKVFYRGNPVLSVELPDGERAQFVMPPACKSGTVSLTVRKISRSVIEIEDYKKSGFFNKIRKSDSVDPNAQKLHDLYENLFHPDEALRISSRSEFLVECVKCAKTIIIAGETGSGKTTFMKALMQHIPSSQRIITIEDVPELLYGLPKHGNQVNLFYPSEATEDSSVTAASLMRSCLRMKPDRILLAELRGGETYDFLNICLSGHAGSITSCHAGSCEQVFEYLALKVLQSNTGRQLPYEVIQKLLHQVIDVIVHVHRDHRDGRHITEIFYADPLNKGVSHE